MFYNVKKSDIEWMLILFVYKEVNLIEKDYVIVGA